MKSISASKLPRPQTQSAAVSFDSTFLLIGGWDADFNVLPYIYKYDVQTDNWIKLTNQLKTPRKQHVALLVPQNLFPECT